MCGVHPLSCCLPEQDACSAVAINSSWAKAHWRKAVALRGLKRMPEAVQAFHQASCILKGTRLPSSLPNCPFRGSSLLKALELELQTQVSTSIVLARSEDIQRTFSQMVSVPQRERERVVSGDQECEQALWAAIQRLTQEQLGQAILDSISRSISQV